MKVERTAAFPLVTCDPYFSIWSAHDTLNAGDTTHWSGKPQSLHGYVKVGDTTYCFLGNSDFYSKLPQTGADVTATRTTFTFENEFVQLTAAFTTPLLLEDKNLVSRPCSYIDVEIAAKTGLPVQVYFSADADMVRNDNGAICGGQNEIDGIRYSLMGKVNQTPLGGSGDNVTINWGYLYLATEDGTAGFDEGKERLEVCLPFEKSNRATVVLAYDDLVSINYFGDFVRGYWTKKDKTIVGAIRAAIREHGELLDRCSAFDKKLEEMAERAGGKDYAFLCSMSYRQSISAHKLIESKEGKLLFLSKENDSNGCIGTSDVSYPSIPLYMLFDTEYVKGMIRPIMDFARCDAWEYDYAPHDVGRYPYAWGQVYGVDRGTSKMQLGNGWRFGDGAVYPPYYQFPRNSNVYEHKYQMPVEECGNMIIMIYNVCRKDKTCEFAREYLDILEKWVKYLVEFGADPDEQLCTDDFAGHLAHNVNLSFKAIMGIEAYALLAQMNGSQEEYANYHRIAKEMAADCVARADGGDHTKLTYGADDSWSLKYNLVWDRIWGSGLFSEELFQRETAYYIKKANRYGTPLDSRQDFTKSDWVLWCAAMAEDRDRRLQMIAPVADYLKNTTSRVPFSDWYNGVTGEYYQFIARSVQGGIFMPMLYDAMK